MKRILRAAIGAGLVLVISGCMMYVAGVDIGGRGFGGHAMSSSLEQKGSRQLASEPTTVKAPSTVAAPGSQPTVKQTQDASGGALDWLFGGAAGAGLAK